MVIDYEVFEVVNGCGVYVSTDNYRHVSGLCTIGCTVRVETCDCRMAFYDVCVCVEEMKRGTQRMFMGGKMAQRISKHRKLELMYMCYQYNDWCRNGEARKMEIVETCCRRAGGDIYRWLLQAVTEPGITYTTLRMRGMPCGKNYFYKRRRIFFSLLDGMV